MPPPSNNAGHCNKCYFRSFLSTLGNRWNTYICSGIHHRNYTIEIFFRSATSSRTRMGEKRVSNQKVSNRNKLALSCFHLQPLTCNWILGIRYMFLDTYYSICFIYSLLPETFYLICVTWFFFVLDFAIWIKCSLDKIVTYYFLRGAKIVQNSSKSFKKIHEILWGQDIKNEIRIYKHFDSLCFLF